MTRKNWRMVNFDLFPEQYRALKVLAALKNCPSAEIVRYAIDKYLSDNLSEYNETQLQIKKYKEYNKKKVE